MKKSRPNRGTPLLWIAVSLLLGGILAYPATAEAQGTGGRITGVVTSSEGQPLPGVQVFLPDTRQGSLTEANGRYLILNVAPGTHRVQATRIGYGTQEQTVTVAAGAAATANFELQVEAARLDELVVTGYQTQRRSDITSAIATVDVEAIERETSSSVLQRLSGHVPGVTVEAGGSPGARSTVRIRGVSSFQNNNPLYIIDGTPVEESYANFLNPNDIETIQVLKDASAASIYGARASNGVVIITTKQGRRGAPQVSLDANFGVAAPVRGYDDFLMLSWRDYFEFERRRFVNAGQDFPDWFTALYGDPNNPTRPQYIYAAPGTVTGRDQWGRPIVDESRYSFPTNNANCCLIMPGSEGTNWWDEVFGTGQVRDVNLSVLGGGANERYNVGFGYFDQEGTAAFNRYQRGTVRVNTSFDVGRFTVGENFSVALEESYGGLAADNLGEGNIIGKNILSQPVIPVRDVAGNFASGKAVGLGNNTNPVKVAENGQNNRNRNNRIFGNAFARYAITDGLTANTSLGINAGEGSWRGYNPIFPENSEPTMVNSIFEGQYHFTTWTWNNTLNFQESFADRHNLSLLVGQEAIQGRDRTLSGSIANLVTTDINARYINTALADPGTRSVSSGGGTSALLSFFGKADYNFAERYYLSGTLRRDGSSRLGPTNRWGTFPAFSLGWRVSQEPFMANNALFSNLMLRASWGITGNQNIAAGRVVDWFGGSVGTSFYDIAGTGNRAVTGFRQTAIGNQNLRWEENESINLGIDAEFLGGSATLVVDVYQRDSDNLLFNPPLPATAGIAAAPIVNIGQMRNRGIDLGLGLRGTLANGIGWNVDLNGAHYKNEIVRIDGQREEFFGPVGTRTASSVTINRLGQPIGSFYGLRHAGIFQSQQEIDQLNAQARQKTGNPSAEFQRGAAPGRFRFEDVNGDGVVTAADRTIIGDPHPDFTAGLNLGLNWRNWDLSGSLFGTFGNQIFDVQKEFYVFSVFPTNVRRDLLTESAVVENGVVTNPNAKYPRLDRTDLFSQQPSSFYVEDGSYVRLRSLQIGYTVPQGRFAGFNNVRVYVRGENLFTITGYDGLDPSLPALEANAAGMDVRDQARGIDRGVYPSNRIISIGFGVGF